VVNKLKNALCVKCGSGYKVYRNIDTKELLCDACRRLYKKYGEIDLSRKKDRGNAKLNREINSGKCSVCNSKQYISYSRDYGNYLCASHLAQFRRCGKIINKEITKNKVWINSYNYLKYYTELIIKNKQTDKEYIVKIDKEDVEKLSKAQWGIQTGCSGNKKGVYVRSATLGIIHRCVMGYPKELVVDHINHDTFDNRKQNLRICTNQQNCMNSSLHSINTSGCSGVSFIKNGNKWWARIGLNGERITLGYFTDKQDAIQARKNAEEEYYGEFRNIVN
jgi:hypothetical protein